MTRALGPVMALLPQEHSSRTSSVDSEPNGVRGWRGLISRERRAEPTTAPHFLAPHSLLRQVIRKLLMPQRDFSIPAPHSFVRLRCDPGHFFAAARWPSPPG